MVPLPEGDRYLGFVFARGPTPAGVELALRRAEAALDVVVRPGCNRAAQVGRLGPAASRRRLSGEGPGGVHLRAGPPTVVAGDSRRRPARRGHQVRCADLAVGTLSADDVDWAEGVALSVPMHTAMRLALRVAGTVRARRPGLPLCFYGLYAAMARDLTVSSPPMPSSPGSSSPG